MKDGTKIKKYKDGQRSCPICSDPLPAHETWQGARYRYCHKPACTVEVKRLEGGAFIASDERLCDGPDCGRFVPEGRYTNPPKCRTCSGQCWLRHSRTGLVSKLCSCGCGQILYRRPDLISESGKVFVSGKHKGAYETEAFMRGSCGVFYDLAKEYMEGYARQHYKPSCLSIARTSICWFLRFVTIHETPSLEAVGTKEVSQYLQWADSVGSKTAGHNISFLKTFFDWMIFEDRRKSQNPVLTKFHYPRKVNHEPRPLSTVDLDFAWDLLNKRGNAKLRFAMSLLEDSGIRIGEICRMRMSDIDLVTLRCFVGLPNKTNRERHALFTDRTKHYYEEWMMERDPGCEHDYVLHNTNGRQMTSASLHREFVSVLCKSQDGRQINEFGLDRWSTHRLRHTMASRLAEGGADLAIVKTQGGWESAQSMAGYTKVPPAAVRRSYDDAMKKFAEQQKSTIVQTLSPTEFLKRISENGLGQKIASDERCV